MKSDKDDLSNAVVLCLGYGISSAPIRNMDAVIGVYGEKIGTSLFYAVHKLTDEVAQIQIDWTNNSLEKAGEIIRAEMKRRHPDLSDRALDAIVWKFTFDWR